MSRPGTGRQTPLLALLLAGGALTSMAALPEWLPVVAVAAAALLGGAALTRRRSRGLSFAIAVVAVSLAIGLAGAWLLRDRPAAGVAWTLLVLGVLPLPLVPWLYWLTFEAGERGKGRGESEEAEEKANRAKGGGGPRPGRMTARHVHLTDSELSPLSPLSSSLPTVPCPLSPDPREEGAP
jgi:hypothetical protein